MRRITKINVTKLFGIFNHIIPLNAKEEHITIIHGLNGFGKTTLLRMLNGIFHHRYSELRSIPFSEFSIDFDDGSTLKVTQSIKKNEDQPRLEFSFRESDLERKYFTLEPKDFPEQNFSPSIIEKIIPEITRISATTWIYLPTNEELSLEDILERFGNLLPIKSNPLLKKEQWFEDLKKTINVRFIESQRLLSFSDDRRLQVNTRRQPLMVPSVSTYSRELAESIQSKLAEYGELSRTLERTFPSRILQQKSPGLSEGKIHNKLAEIEQENSRLIKAGLLDTDNPLDFSVEQNMDETIKNILSVYIEDVEKKLQIFSELVNKIELFQKIITERFSYKKMQISKEDGFTFIGEDNKPLSPAKLSSGEQHELVLLYELLFKVPSNSLILIDEPELSFHVAWQVQFLKDLQDIIKLANFDILIATHSPDIINDRWDLTVELKEPTP
jgi:predicted ATP-binding protein involved in virulence